MVNRVYEYMVRHKMIAPGSRVLAAVSGGADSMCLLEVLRTLRLRAGFELRVLHVHHGLRESAEGDLVHVSKYCRSAGIPFQAVRVDAGSYAAKAGMSVEEAARYLRYGALEEAARLDGANDLVIMFRIILPLCKATFAVVMLFTIVGQWNNFMSALLYLPSKEYLNPLQIELRKILYESTKEITSASDVSASSVYARSVEYAAIVVSTLPILIVYPFFQDYFVKGITMGAVKG